MNPKHVRALVEIATVLKEREMAELAAANRRKALLLERRTALHRQRVNARNAAMESTILAQAAETFEIWSRAADEKIGAELAEAEGTIAAQKRRTTLAVGRHRNICELEAHAQDAAAKAAARRV